MKNFFSQFVFQTIRNNLKLNSNTYLISSVISPSSSFFLPDPSLFELFSVEDVVSIFRILLDVLVFVNGREVCITFSPLFPEASSLGGGGTAQNARLLHSKKSIPSLAMTLEDKRHSFMAFRKNCVGVPTFPWGAIEGGRNSDKRPTEMDLFNGKARHLSDRSSWLRSVQCFKW